MSWEHIQTSLSNFPSMKNEHRTPTYPTYTYICKSIVEYNVKYAPTSLSHSTPTPVIMR